MNHHLAVSAQRQRRRPILLGLLFTIIMILIGVVAGWMLGRAARQDQPTLPIIGRAPVYHGFLNQLSQPVNSSAFAGKVRLVTFLFPYCSGYCPLIAKHLAGVETELKCAGLQNRVQLIAFDLDPGHTGPTQDRVFLKQYGWNPHNLHWQFLSGSVAQTRHLVRDGYHVYYQQVTESKEDAYAAQEKAAGTYKLQPHELNALAERVKPNYDVAHMNSLVLVDPQGRVRWVSLQANRVSGGHLLTLIRSLLPPAPEKGNEGTGLS